MKHTPQKAIHTGWQAEKKVFNNKKSFQEYCSYSLFQRPYKKTNKKIIFQARCLFKVRTKLKANRNPSFFLQIVITETSTWASLCQGLLDLGPPKHHHFCVLTPLRSHHSEQPWSQRGGLSRLPLYHRSFPWGPGNPTQGQATSSQCWVGSSSQPGTPPSLARGPTWWPHQVYGHKSCLWASLPLSWRTGKDHPGTPDLNSWPGLSTMSNSTRGNGSERQKAGSSRNLKIRMRKFCGHRGGQGQDRRGDGPGMAQCISMEFHKIRDKQDLKIFLLLFNPFTLVTKKPSKRSP